MMAAHPLDDFALLVDGKEAFPEILACIGRATRSIEINMFIWRNDEIGCAIARAVLEAADRGVRVHLSVDRVGAVLELAEEHRASFFHRRVTVTEQIKVLALRLAYPALSTKARAVDDGALYHAILHHPNITADLDTRKADHSKYYIFDDEVLILGGINIEDKENGQDISGRVYQDYMIKLTGAQYVTGLRHALTTGLLDAGDYGFCVNTKTTVPPCFAMGEHYLAMIGEARQTLTVAMAYFAPPTEMTDAIADAVRRGVKVTLLIPAHANFMNHASLAAAARLMKQTAGAIHLRLTPKMMHTKLIANESRISMGSANMMKNAFTTLSELNLIVRRSEHPFCRRVLDSLDKTLSDAKTVTSPEELRYSRLLAIVEGWFE